MKVDDSFEDEINKYYRTIDVTEPGIDYILKHLRYGRTLSNLVGRFIPIESGKVETFVHRDVKEKDILQIGKGYIGRDIPEILHTVPRTGSTWELEPAMDFFVAPIIQAFGKEDGKRGVCILEHIDAYPTDPFIHDLIDAPVITLCNRDVYFFLKNGEKRIDIIQETFDYVPSWSAIAFLSSVTTDIKPFRSNQKIDLESLEKIAKGTKKIIISAYDGEGYLVWRQT